ncbi:MAG: MauE/DoxX family redox-associated membrane protein [Myxococcota bacterium]
MSGAPNIDPALQLSLRMALALLFLISLRHKLRDFAAFRTSLAGYRILPSGCVTACAVGFMLAEACLAAALLAPGLGVASALGATALLGVYSAAIGINLLRGRREIDCGCRAPGAGEGLSEALLVRNALLILVALQGALPAGGRGFHWLDGFTAVGGAICLALLYTAVDSSLANGLRLRRSRRSRREEAWLTH